MGLHDCVRCGREDSETINGCDLCLECGELADWEPASTVPDGVEVETKIDDEHGVRNVTTLVHERNLWWFPDRSMYVYYVPTHWRPLTSSLKV
jgi:hypothetical protein